MSTEQHIDPEVSGVATDALLGILGDALDRVPGSEIEIAAEAAIRAVDEKRRELAQAVPEGQEYAYRICWEDAPDGPACFGCLSLGEALRRRDSIASSGVVVWVERALLGTWEKIG